MIYPFCDKIISMERKIETGYKLLQDRKEKSAQIFQGEMPHRTWHGDVARVATKPPYCLRVGPAREGGRAGGREEEREGGSPPRREGEGGRDPVPCPGGREPVWEGGSLPGRDGACPGGTPSPAPEGESLSGREGACLGGTEPAREGPRPLPRREGAREGPRPLPRSLRIKPRTAGTGAFSCDRLGRTDYEGEV